ncbi:integration host factor subunit alpha [Rhodoblastus acidophilus]|uniref:Integration host factor subunit alpha n=1 Tax=Rhodoblastus acidophilus TaxID=1074 RepID=A0A212S7R1_RHOAC|nr:integration host factor subunit alpha [Rhodoblastus acidophilus]
MSSNSLSVDTSAGVPSASVPSARVRPVAPVVEKRTVTRSDLAEALFRRVGLSRMESAQLVEMVISEVSDAIARGENVKLSSFGTFLQRDKRERVGRNPKTGVEARITPRRVLVFRASHIMRARINGAEG